MREYVSVTEENLASWAAVCRKTTGVTALKVPQDSKSGNKGILLKHNGVNSNEYNDCLCTESGGV